jgi:hypothetical protein
MEKRRKSAALHDEENFGIAIRGTLGMGYVHFKILIL